MQYSRKWEFISDNSARLQVPDGWIVRSWIASSLHLIFIKDEKHEWKLE